MEILSKIKKNINLLLITAYISIVWFVSVYLSNRFSVIEAFIFMIISLVVIFLASKKIMNIMSGKEILIKHNTPIKNSLIVFATASLICLAVFLLWYLAYLPGGFVTDSFTQYEQAINGQYNDWHPVWHTFLFFTIPLKLTGNASSIILFQLVYFSFIIGYLTMVMYKYAGLKLALISFVFIVGNTYINSIVMFPTKDVAFAMFGLLAMTISTDLVMSKSFSKENWWKFLILGFVLANATVLRHNAILFTGLIAFALFFFAPKKQMIIMIVAMLLTVFIIKVPVYSLLNVESPDKRIVETVGLPVTIIGNVAKETPEALDEETAEFIFSVAPQEAWEKYYECGDFNSIKFSKEFTINSDAIEEAGYLKIFRMTLSCFKSSPSASIDALLSLTDMVYKFEGPIEGNLTVPEILSNDFGIKYEGNLQIKNFLEGYKYFMENTIFKYSLYIGVTIIIVLFSILSKNSLSKWSDWKKILLCLPILAYNFGTMLFLCSNDSRFFFISFLVWPLIILISFSKLDVESAEQNTQGNQVKNNN